MAGLTRSLITRHPLGRADAYDAALLDVAQDHLLYLLAAAGAFDDGQLAFKGGTSLRKCRLGNDGRFSTDLDFAAPNEDTVLEVCGIIDGARVAGFEYRRESDRGDGRHWRLRVNHPDLGTPDIAASVEFARRPLALPTESLGFVPLPIHKQYVLTLPMLPVVAEAEACAEKLVRRLWVLKVWGDVVDDRRGNKPADPNDVLHQRQERDFQPDSIGVLTRPVDLLGWEARVRTRFQFLTELDDDERRWATCDERHRREVESALAALSDE